MRYETHNLDGTGPKRTRVYDLPTIHPHDYWANVTNIPCPQCPTGTIQWAEAGYVPGYRICDTCGKHYLAKGTTQQPKLLRVRNRTTKIKTKH